MSRIGKLPITIPAGVTVTVKDDVVTVKGKNGEMSQKLTGGIQLGIEDGKVEFTRPNDEKQTKALHGLYHAIYMVLPKEVKLTTKSERNQNPLITLESCDKALLGLICTKIRSFRKPEPYKGKGVLYVGEVVRRKSGKSAGAK